MICPECKTQITYLATLVNKDKTLTEYFYCLKCHKELSQDLSELYSKLNLREKRLKTFNEHPILSISLTYDWHKQPDTTFGDYNTYEIMILTSDGWQFVCRYKDLAQKLSIK